MPIGNTAPLSTAPRFTSKPPKPGEPGGGAAVGSTFLGPSGQNITRLDDFNYYQEEPQSGFSAYGQRPASGGSTGGGANTGGGGPTPPREPAPGSVARESAVSMSPSASSLGQLDEAGASAQRAVFGRAKDRAGQIASSALTGLRSALASRGVLGSGMETQGTVDAAMQGANIIGDVSREEAIQESQRGERAREFQTQAQLQQRGQDISQRGQDLGQILGLRGQDITQRGQDVSASLGGLQAAGGNSQSVSTYNPYLNNPRYYY